MKNAILFLTMFLCTFFTYGQTNKVKVQLHSIVGFGKYEDFAKEAATLLENVLNSEEFKIAVLKGTYLKTNGLSNQQLYDIIMKAHELQGEGGQDGVVDLRIRTLRVDNDESNWKDNCNRSTIGIDDNETGVIGICPNKLKIWAEKNKVNELAGHFAHEYMHILGFNHYNPLRGQKWKEKTFVYIIGNLVSELIEKEIKK